MKKSYETIYKWKGYIYVTFLNFKRSQSLSSWTSLAPRTRVEMMRRTQTTTEVQLIWTTTRRHWGSRRRNWSWWSKRSPCTALRTERSSRHSHLSSLDSPVRPNKYWFLAGGHSGLLFEKQAAFFNQRVLFLGVGWNVDLHDCEIGDGIVVTTMILEKWFYMPPIIPLVFGFGVCTLHFTR